MQERTIAVKVTPGDMVELYITGEDVRCVIVDAVPMLDVETRHVPESGLMGCVLGEPTGDVPHVVRCTRVGVQVRRRAREAKGARGDVSLQLATQLSEVTAMLDRISAALGVRHPLKGRRRTRKAQVRRHV